MAANCSDIRPCSPLLTHRKTCWARLATFATALMLSGCAALQIDVDVYKGPLINNEDIQRDQVLSMALSAKPLLLELRNKLLDSVKPNWHDSKAEQRRSTLTANQLDELAKDAVDDPKRNALRSARQLNNVITFYDDLGEPRMRSTANFIEEQEKIYERLLLKANAMLADRNNRYSDVKRSPVYRQAHEAQAVVWAELVALFHDVASAQAYTATSDAARANLLHELAHRIAERTQPWLVACVLKFNASLAKRLRGAQANPGPTDAVWNSARYRTARTALARALERNPVEGVWALQQIDTLLRSGQPSACFNAQSAGAKMPSEATHDWFANTGLTREPRLGGKAESSDADNDDSDQPKSLVELIAGLYSLGASGFDHGRTHLGIDSLADRYANLRNRANRFAASDAAGKADRDSALSEFRRVEHLLVDLATRMQFLATNLWLLEDGAASSDYANANAYRVDGSQNQPTAAANTGLNTDDLARYKTMMEAIANNLLVHADDLRNRAQYKERQTSQGPVERDAAGAAFALSSDAAFAAIEQGLLDAKNKASTLETGASTLDIKITELNEAIGKRKTEFAAVIKTAQALAEQARSISDLALTLGVGQGAKAAKDVGDDGAAQRKNDADVADKKLNKTSDPAEVTQETLREELAAWLKPELAIYTSPALLSHPRGVRLASALLGLETFKVSEPLPSGPRKQQLASFKLRVVQARDAALRASAEDPPLKLDLEGARLGSQLEKAQQAQQAQRDKLPFLPTADAVAALTQVKSVKLAVLAELAASPAAIDFSSTQRMLSKHLAKAEKEAAAGGSAKAELAVALKAVEQLPPLSRLEVAQLPADSKAIDVLDAVIAQLRYKAIEAERLFGSKSETTERATAALARAMKDREQQIFIRPSSTYLRSVYTATSLQTDPTLGHRNMLLDQFKNVVRNDKVDRTRIDMDKTFWQNINTVRVSASGASNFVLAKDDVGNWYVKAMGADPQAMINAAKGMALYSMGGRINTNLLRVDELQQKIEAEKDPAKATALRNELTAINNTDGAPAVGARSETLSLFVKNYDAQTATHLKDLAAALAGDLYFAEIQKRWAESLKAPGDPKALDKLFVDPEVSKHMADARTAADAEKTGKDAAAALIKAMQSLQRLRGTLKTLVRSQAALTATEAGEVSAKTTAINGAKLKLADAEKLVGESNDALLLVIGQLDAAKTTGDSAKVATEEVKVDLARKLDTSRRNDFKGARTSLAGDEEKLKSAEAVLAAAKKRQQDAIDDVDKVLKTAVSELADKRVRVVEETQTAVKVIGRSSP